MNMAKTVDEAFNKFVAEEVDLDREVTARARASRNWLVEQLRGLHQADAEFPLAYPDKDIFYGSFHRRTKIRELDDIDLISGISAEGATYNDQAGRVSLSAAPSSRLSRYCNDGSLEVNSRKVLNAFVRALSRVPQYGRADLNRNGEAAVLELVSYGWSFDIVPGFFTKPEFDGRQYYLIPDGSGAWKKTDPRIDEARVTQVRERHGRVALSVIRLVKYWNRRARIKTMSSYLLEVIVLNYFLARPAPEVLIDAYPDISLSDVFSHIAAAVLGAVQDPKNLQGDLNDLGFADRLAIHARANLDANTASRAREAESRKDHPAAIRLWKEIFGEEFPAYG